MRMKSILGGLLVLLLAAPTFGADGKAIYNARCSFCHGVEGRGDGPVGASLKPPPMSFATAEFAKRTDEQIKDAIVQGRTGTAMIAFGKTLPAEDIEALTQYIRTFAPK